MTVSDRMVICVTCPLMKETDDGAICNPRLTIDPKTLDVSTKDKPGYYRGCNCIIEDKITNEDESCPAGRW